MPAALRSVGLLEALSGTPAETFPRAPCSQARLSRLAAKPDEQWGLRQLGARHRISRIRRELLISMPDCGSDPGMKESQGRELSGLCGTCLKADVCVLARVSALPLLECVAYQAAGQVPVPSADTPARQDRFKGADRQRGLCADCELRNHCAFPRPESGVWHCVHYR
jgi:hypothetical protein